MGTEASLYERLGGDSAINAAAELLYHKIYADPLLAPYFADVDMAGQIAMQAAFLTMALGGPAAYSGRALRAVHARLPGLSDEHVDRVAEHLAATLRELGVGDSEIAEAMAVAASVRDDVLNR